MGSRRFQSHGPRRWASAHPVLKIRTSSRNRARGLLPRHQSGITTSSDLPEGFGPPTDRSTKGGSVPPVFPNKLRPLLLRTSHPATMHLPLHRRPLRKRGTWPWKRRVDVGLTLALLPLLLPLIALIWLWIRCVSRGSALFRQRRVGRDGKTFIMYKFRSMRDGCPQHTHFEHVRSLVRSGEPMTKLDSIGDDRLIPGGRLMRAIALDELPQLFNVLRGEMSLVGPRPCLPEEFALFTQDQKKRFSVPPGITGLWQVGGKNTTTFSEMGELDKYYSGHATLWVDLAILVRTPGAIIQHAHRQTFRRNAAPELPKPAHAGDRSNGGSLRNL